MSAPSSPGGVSSVSASRSAADDDERRRSRGRRRDAARGGRATSPSVPGYCSSTPKTVAPRARRRDVADDDCDAERLRARAHHGDRLRMAVVRDEERPASRSRARARQSAIASAAAVASSSSDALAIGEPGEVGDHRLEVEQRLEAALRDLRLVRRVRRVPGRVLEDVAQDHRRRVRAVVAHADERRAAPGSSPRARRSAASASGSCPRARKSSGGVSADRRRDHGVHQRVDARRSRARRASPLLRSASGPMWRRANAPWSSSRTSSRGRARSSFTGIPQALAVRVGGGVEELRRRRRRSAGLSGTARRRRRPVHLLRRVGELRRSPRRSRPRPARRCREAAFTDSTTPTASPAATLRPDLGHSTKTMSPSCSWAWSVMPTVDACRRARCGPTRGIGVAEVCRESSSVASVGSFGVERGSCRCATNGGFTTRARERLSRTARGR